MFIGSQISHRLRSLEQHLKQENPVLSEVVKSFRELDRITRRLGYFNREESHAIRTPWWPLISVLGLYSSGKSTFINHYLDYRLQNTGNQAVDDKFTVICYTRDNKVRVLPGLALDADPRFPLFKVSQAIEEVAAGEGAHIDAYLQLKTCPSEKIRGKIFIDSPGFDADAQRTSTLRITHHIMNLSDLVLVFFDARHPESGSMRDTLEHLVGRTINRRDSNKFVYILNQIDTTALEDNPEEVFAAWQRALAQHGLTAGTFYCIYNEDAAVPIEDERTRNRFERKRDTDLEAIHKRIDQVGVERAYRIVGMLEQTAHMLKQEVVPRIQRFITSWRRKILLLDGIIFGVLTAAFFILTIWGGYWQGLSLKLPFLDPLPQNIYPKAALIAVVVLIVGYIHYCVRKWSTKKTTRKFLAEINDEDLNANYAQAFRKNTGWRRSVFNLKPAGWRKGTIARLAKVVDDTNIYIQKLNDMYANPSGEEESGKMMEVQPTPGEPVQAAEPSGNETGEPAAETISEETVEARRQSA